MNITQLKKWASAFVKIYISAVLLYQTLWQIVPVRVFLCNTGLDVISSVLAVLGFAFLAVDIFIERTAVKSKYSVFLIAAVAVMGLSSLVYIKYGWVDNAKVIVWQVVQMFLIYSFYLRMDRERLRAYLRDMFIIISAVFTVAVIASLYQYVMQTSYVVQVDGGNCRQGFQEGRLFGVFGSIYFASLLISLLGVGSVYSAVKSRKKWLKALFALQALLFFIYVVLSGTRSVLVALIIGIILCAAVCARNIINSRKINFKKWGKALCAAAASVVCAVVFLGAYASAEKLLVKIPSWAGTVQDETNQPQPGLPDEDVSDAVIDDILTRPDVHGDVSNNRFSIWKDYFNCVFSGVKPALLGFSPGAYMKIIKQEFPDIFIVSYIRDKYPLSYSLDRIYDTHNGYVALAAGTGLLGLLAMGAFLALYAYTTLRHFIRSKKTELFEVLLFTLLAVIVVSVFFDSDLFYKCTCTSVIFWLLAGFMMKEIDCASVQGAPAAGEEAGLEEKTPCFCSELEEKKEDSAAETD